MEIKFTVRDILVYFLTGIGLVFMLMVLFFKEIMDYQEAIFEVLPKENQTLIIILLIPLIYLLGHIADSIDLIRLKIASLSKPKESNRKFWYKLKRFVYLILVGDRVTGIIYKQKGKNNISEELRFSEFWESVNYNQVKGKYNVSEYFEALKDLFSALQSVALVGIFVSMIFGNWIAMIPLLFILILFWLKTSYYSEVFIASVDNVYKILKEEPELIKVSNLEKD